MRNALPPVLAALGLIVLWQVYASAGPLGDDVLPPPTAVAEAGWSDRGDLARATMPTVVGVLLGFSVSLAVAFVLSVLLDRSRPARRAIMPLLIGSQTLPIIVLAPLMVLWFGLGLTPKILLVTLVTFFPVVVGLLDGYASSDRDTTTLLRTMGAGWWTEFRLLRLPAAMPSFFTGLRISITYAVVAVIFAEYASPTGGLGVYMQAARNSFRPDLVLAAVAVCATLTLALFATTVAVQRAVMPWYADARRRDQ